jgi:general stress protein CsbA
MDVVQFDQLTQSPTVSTVVNLIPLSILQQFIEPTVLTTIDVSLIELGQLLIAANAISTVHSTTIDWVQTSDQPIKLNIRVTPDAFEITEILNNANAICTIKPAVIEQFQHLYETLITIQSNMIQTTIMWNEFEFDLVDEFTRISRIVPRQAITTTTTKYYGLKQPLVWT